MSTKYSTTIANMLEQCSEYRLRKVSLDKLKRIVWEAAQRVESSDEHGLRQSLQVIEGRLDMVQFTTDSDKVFDASIPVIQELEDLARNVL